MEYVVRFLRRILPAVKDGAADKVSLWAAMAFPRQFFPFFAAPLTLCHPLLTRHLLLPLRILDRIQDQSLQNLVERNTIQIQDNGHGHIQLFRAQGRVAVRIDKEIAAGLVQADTELLTAFQRHIIIDLI
jgi:hypothetical protein